VRRSDRVRQQGPVQATSFRHGLPPGVGFPSRRVRGMLRHRRSIQWGILPPLA
jgi:hypothetical protein